MCVFEILAKPFIVTMNALRFHPEKCLELARQSTDGELLDQVVFFRPWLEEGAVAIMEAELHRRGIKSMDQRTHESKWSGKLLRDGQGFPKLCARCRRAATTRRIIWAKLFGLVPLFPRPEVYCPEHDGENDGDG